MVNIKVAVRVRPFSSRESMQTDIIAVDEREKCILVTNPKILEKFEGGGDSRQRIRRFAVDYYFDSRVPNLGTQETIYNEIGNEILDYAMTGYNACVLAYGHSASGKTFTMMGDDSYPGLKPRICQGIFQRINMAPNDHHVLTASFLEIYNEKVRDLLVDEDGSFTLRVREHPRLGPYVQGLSEIEVSSEEDLIGLLQRGNCKRSTAVTETNNHSSRSHAVFTLRLHRSNNDSVTTSKVHLVDLAGSERAGSIHSRVRLKEGANINKSLVTLGNVISALADSCEIIWPRETKNWQPFVPYRDSVLTWLLKDTLGGNANTIMIATISPANNCYTDTINTLRYAKRTKKIINQPRVNEDPKLRTIRELKEEVTRLKTILLKQEETTTLTLTPVSQCAIGLQTENPDIDWLKSEWTGGEPEVKETTPTQSLPHCESSNENSRGNESYANRNGEIIARESSTFRHGVPRTVRTLLLKRRRIRQLVRQSLRGQIPITMLHRSRPDLIKSIKAHSASSNTSAPGLSQSTSETSLNSTGRRASLSRTSSLGEASECSTPTSILKEKDKKRGEIVSAVTSRLYDINRKSDVKDSLESVDMDKKNDDQEKLKLCKRTRMKLFDISRKLALTKGRARKPVVDHVVQTDNSNTVRVKEKSTVTDQLPQISSNSDHLDCQPVTINHVVVPSGRFILDCGENVRLESSVTIENSTQTDPAKVEQGTSPRNFEEINISKGCQIDKNYSQHGSQCCHFALRGKRKKYRHSTGNISHKSLTNLKRSLDSLLQEHLKTSSINMLRGQNRQAKHNARGLFQQPLRCPSLHTQSICDDTSHESDLMSSDTSLNSMVASDCVSSSGTSSEDFVFYEKHPGQDSPKTTDLHELYTISESSELTDAPPKVTISQTLDNEGTQILNNPNENDDSSDSLTFIYLGPKLQETAIIADLIRKSLQSKSITSKEKKVCTPQIQRAISVDTAMNVLHNLVKPDIARTSSVDFTKLNEKSCQSDFKDPQLRYSVSTLTSEDKEINTNLTSGVFELTKEKHKFVSPFLPIDSEIEKPLQIDCSSQTKQVRFCEDAENELNSNLGNHTQIVSELIKEATDLIKTLKIANEGVVGCSNITNNQRLSQVLVTESVQTDVEKVNQQIQTNEIQVSVEIDSTLNLKNLTWPRRRSLSKPPIPSKMALPQLLTATSKSQSLSSNSDNGYSKDEVLWRNTRRRPYDIITFELQESCKRLEEAVYKDRIREENFKKRTKSLILEQNFSTFNETKRVEEYHCCKCSPFFGTCNSKCSQFSRSSPSAYLKHLVALRKRIVCEELAP